MTAIGVFETGPAQATTAKQKDVATSTNNLLKAIVAISTFLAQRRKFLTAVIGPWILVAGNYLGGMPVTHLWYVIVILEAIALGVYEVPNDPMV